MAKKNRPIPVSPELIEQRIHIVRGQRVMLDSDLAEVYQTTTMALNQAVKRNKKRFPDHFAFPLTQQEVRDLKSQSVISSSGHGGRRKPPWAFTEHGVAMLSSVLHSRVAVQVSIEIINVFVRLRRLLATPGELVEQLQKLAETVQLHDEQIKVITEVLRKLMEPPPQPPKGRIGFQMPQSNDPAESKEYPPMNLFHEFTRNMTRRHFFAAGSHAVGWAALASLLDAERARGDRGPKGKRGNFPHFPGKAKNVIYLHMVGGPPQMDLYDYKPQMQEWFDKDLPDSVRMGQRLTTMTSGQKRFPIAPSKFKFKQHGKCGMWVSELLPWTAKMVDDMCFIRGMHTEAINHEPAITYMQTGNQVTGRPCLGAWVSYGLGSLNHNLPTFVVQVAKPSNTEQVQAISARLWASGYLSGEHAGVSFRSSGDPILYINNPPGVPAGIRRKTLDGLQKLNEMNYRAIGDPETNTRIQQYEMAFRMQSSVPELTDLSREPQSTFKLYGDDAKKPGTFANTVLLARRMVERGVRFVQIYHNNWDTHANVAGRLPDQCRDVDQACYGLIQDLKKRGMFDETLVIWGGEFGRTIYSQGGLSKKNYGRDHHPRCFTMWMAGGGTRPGTIHGETDDFSYNIVKDPVHIHDFHATILHLLGFDHRRFTYRYQGLDQRLTGVEPASVVKELLA